MQQQTEHIQTLFQKYIQQTSSPQEEQELAGLVEQYTNDELADILEPIAATTKADPQFNLQDWEQVIQSIIQHPAEEEHKPTIIRRINWYKRIAIAASILLVVSLGLYYIITNSNHHSGPDPESLTKMKDVEAPKVTKATITLADGRTISIDSLTTLTQNNVTIIKSAEGKIIYTGTAYEVVYNTLSNPRGSKVIDMMLADGSRVWLNAGSSVTYPVAFIGNERKVSITGEAYFEVAASSSTYGPNLRNGSVASAGGALKPFIVQKGDMSVTVLGTHFNVNAYDDESEIKVTLLEGSVKVNNKISNSILKPAQQAVVTNDIRIVNDANLDEVMAWKNGIFYFSKADIGAIMRKIIRWYDVDVEFVDPIPGGTFSGDVNRNTNVSNVLKMLKLSGINYRIENSAKGRKKIVIMK